MGRIKIKLVYDINFAISNDGDKVSMRGKTLSGGSNDITLKRSRFIGSELTKSPSGSYFVTLHYKRWSLEVNTNSPDEKIAKGISDKLILKL